MTGKIVIIGNNGFVGSNISKNLLSLNKEVIGINRSHTDFLKKDSTRFISKKVSDGDIVVLSAAIAPAKNSEDLQNNIELITNIINAIKSKSLEYLLNISSDAVYEDSKDLISEDTTIYPQGFHGIMHCMREHLLERNLSAPLGHLRPTLIYGENDPHNGYGPNSFLRKTLDDKNIQLFGNGEEQRDHIYVEDVSDIAREMILKKITGPINAVSGSIISFKEIALLMKKYLNNNIEIINNPRIGPMPHNGYRAFNKLSLNNQFPKLKLRSLEEYIANKVMK
ncbi:SDR family oxidoreductase [bacterium]|nr:SDR family oxidoreductase [bacterium]